MVYATKLPLAYLTHTPGRLSQLNSLRRAERAKSAANAKAAKEAPGAFVVYASQTGTAQEIATSIAAEAPSHGIKAKVRATDIIAFNV